MERNNFRKYFSKRLVPGTAAVALLISLLFPVTYYVLQVRSLENSALLHAYALAEKIQVVIGKNPALWKYQAQKYLQAVHEVTAYKDIAAIDLHDEKREYITGLSFEKSGKNVHESPWYYLVSRQAPLIYNNNKIGTVTIYVSRLPLLRETMVIFLLSLITGISLSYFTYRLPIRIAGEADEALSTLVADLDKKVAKRTSELADAYESLQRENEAQILSVTALAESEETLRIITSTAHDAILMLDEAGNVTFWNGAAEKMFGYSEEEIVGRNLHMMLVPPAFREAHNRVFPHFKQTGQGAAVGRTVELAGLRKDGVEFPLELSLSAKQVKGFWHSIGIVRDISARNQANAALKLSEELHRTILQTATLGYLLTDTQGQILDCNETYFLLSGYSKLELLAMNVSDLDMMEKDDVNFLIKKIIAQGEARFESQHRRKDGSIFDIEISVKCLPGATMGLVCFLRDLTEQKLANMALSASEERFKAIFNGATDGILLADAESEKFSGGNAMICRMLGYSVEEISSLGVADIHPEEDLPYVYEQFVKQAKGEVTRITDIPVKRKNGTLFNADISATTLVLSGRPFVVGFFRDITEQKIIENALRESETKFRTLYESTTDAVMLIGESGYEDCNGATLKMFGLSTKEEFIKFNPAQLSPPYQPGGLDSLMAANDKITEAMKSGSNFFEWVHRRSNGEDFSADVLLTTLTIDGGQFLQATVRDITARKAAEDAIYKLNENLEQRVMERTAEIGVVNRELENFAYVVSHDLKAPLRAISSLSNWLAADYADKLDQQGQESLTLLVQRAKRMNSLIDGILEYSRVGRIKGETKIVDLDSVVHEVIDSLAPPENVSMTIETKLPSIAIEQVRIYQLFQNLISNAMKHLDKPTGDIRVGCSDEGQFYSFYVSDNGPGIEDQYFDRIFQLFQTLKPRDEVENTGVGLTIVKKIVEMHGGRVWVESKVGEGATFRFTLPKEMIV